MGGHGASSGMSNKGKPYGSEYKTVLRDGNIKFVKANNGSATAPLETMTRGRVYVTVNAADELKRLFLRGYEEMMKRLDPQWVIFYGQVPPECDWNVIRIAPHYEDIVKRRKNNAPCG